MPFTFSHPAAVLFLRRFTKYFSLAGLVVGSIAPDFEYFLRMKSRYSHTLAGVLYFDLPMALLIAFVFFNICKNELVDNLPLAARSRLMPLRRFDWNKHFLKHWRKVIISILIGVASHLIWDSFTHGTGYFVQHMPVLKTKISSIPLYRVLQHFSTIAGGIFILWVLSKQPKEKVSNKVNPWYWVILLAVFALVSAASLMNSKYNTTWHMVIMLVTALLAALTVTPLMLKAYRALRR